MPNAFKKMLVHISFNHLLKAFYVFNLTRLYSWSLKYTYSTVHVQCTYIFCADLGLVLCCIRNTHNCHFWLCCHCLQLRIYYRLGLVQGCKTPTIVGLACLITSSESDWTRSAHLKSAPTRTQTYDCTIGYGQATFVITFRCCFTVSPPTDMLGRLPTVAMTAY